MMTKNELEVSAQTWRLVDVGRALTQSPETSLARRDAAMKEEALDDLARHMEASGYADEASGVRTYAIQANQ